MKKVALLLCLFLCGSLASFAQMGSWSYGISNDTFTFVTNDCVNNNCWHPATYTSQLTSIGSGGGYTYGLNSSGALQAYSDYPTNSWAAVSGVSAVSQIAVVGHNSVYALESSQSGGCGSPNIGMVHWNGSGDWSRVGTQCGTYIGASADGTLTQVRSSGNGYISTNGGSSFWTATKTGLSGTGFLVLIAARAGDYYAIDTNWDVYKGNGSSSWTQVGTSQMSSIAVDPADNLYGLWANAHGYNYVWHFNGTGWDEFINPVSNPSAGVNSLTNGDQGDAWAIESNGSSSNIFRLAVHGISHNRTLSGNASCSGSCGSVIHSAYVKTGWTNGNSQSTYNNSFAPTTPLNISSSATLFDFWLCFEGNIECTPDDGGAVTCSEDGFLFQDTAPSPRQEVAFTYVTAGSNTGYSCSGAFCKWNVSASCTTSYDWPGPGYVQDFASAAPPPPPPAPSPYWLTEANCFSPGASSPWYCIQDKLPQRSPTNGACTYNP